MLDGSYFLTNQFADTAFQLDPFPWNFPFDDGIEM